MTSKPNIQFVKDAFVELNRQFRRIGDASLHESSADESFSSFDSWRFSDTVYWEDLLKYPRVVVLGEAGSGKTTEFRQQVRKLLARGELAFFVRLDELVENSLDVALGPSEAKVLDRWRHGFREAAFFLDSVDESKLVKPTDFSRALRRFRNAMPPDFVPRTRIYLSGRITDWYPEADGAEFRSLLGHPSIEIDGDDDPHDFLTVHIGPLEWEDASKLLGAVGTTRLPELHFAVLTAKTLDFIRHPLDLLALSEFWERERRIGSLTELIEFDVSSKLAERPSRAGDPLSPADSRAGAEALAAATVLCGNAAFKVRDDSMLADALDGRSCMSATWTDSQFAALLARPIFDCASRGCIRFHHRRVREYLAASWFAARMRDGCSVDQLERVFFERIGTQRVIRRSLAPIAAWLAGRSEGWSDHIRRWILESAPGIHLKFGDPTALSMGYRRSVLRALIQSSNTDSRSWFDSGTDALRQFAEPSMEADVLAAIQTTHCPSQLRVDMLTVARLGRFHSCASDALELLADPNEVPHVRAAALQLIAFFNQPADLERSVATLLAGSDVPEELTVAFLVAFGDREISVSDLWTVLSKTKLTKQREFDSHFHLCYGIRHHLRPEQLLAILQQSILHLSGVANVSNHTDDSHPVNLICIILPTVGSSRVDLQACKLEYSIVSPK